MFKEKNLVILTGFVIGLAALILVAFGNPTNMGFCIACFIRDITGALELHTANGLQYARPEIFGIILGSSLLALLNKEWRATSGSAPVLRFVLGFFMMAGALVFLGCPLRMVLRLGGGDGKAIFALLGFTGGIALGSFFLNKGFTLGRSYKQKTVDGIVLPIIAIVLAVFSFADLIGDASAAKHAPFFLSLGLALIVGGLAQRSRFCMVGGIRDYILFRENRLFLGSLTLFLTVLIGNIILGNFHVSFTTDGSIWFFLSMALVGLCGVLLGGCPLRQLILAGEGNGDSAITVFGMVVGAAVSHNFSTASTPALVKTGGKIEIVVGLIIVSLIGYVIISKQNKEVI
ncbi:MAG: YedE-related selenium metabolism membrane protein [Spirochaetaceae bacterium]|nr:YedE-related selenium metabolism membrane protein [Spirochaetaceae bacterium]